MLEGRVFGEGWRLKQPGVAQHLCSGSLLMADELLAADQAVSLDEPKGLVDARGSRISRRAVKVRDLVIARDSVGGIGPKPDDTIAADAVTAAHAIVAHLAQLG